MGEAVEFFTYSNGFSKVHYGTTHMIVDQNDDEQQQQQDSWFEEEIDVHLKWSFALNSPKSVFIMGGGEGSAAREALRHKSIEKVVMCDIDQEVVDFCKKHLTANHEAFRNMKLDLVINDAKAELEGREEKFDIIVGDLADPVEGGPCYQLYTKSFYQNIVKPKLNNNAIFVTQAGPAGVFTHKEVFSSIYNTIKQASDQPLCIEAGMMDKKIAERIDGELLYLNGASFVASTILNKTVAKTYYVLCFGQLKNETHVYTEDDARFIHGQGVAYRN
ncbi:Thermospermine synthase ACAULIS5 [Sesamum angolense]|uniref:Thermospermine synthase ACAULIS5 n=1 Tax=Sesamum angolense TaxID=2727404 RepID=A0AAE1W8I7_9LAMI|nr:Thermospermine synthase ACAULIS5 [Sesamum angolense]